MTPDHPAHPAHPSQKAKAEAEKAEAKKAKEALLQRQQENHQEDKGWIMMDPLGSTGYAMVKLFYLGIPQVQFARLGTNQKS